MFNFNVSANTATCFHRRGDGFSLSNDRLVCKETVNSSPDQQEREKKIVSNGRSAKFYNLGIGSQGQLFQPCFALAAWRRTILERSTQPSYEEEAPI